MKDFFFSKLGLAITVATVFIVGLFSWQTLGDTTVNVTLKTNPTLKDGLVGHWTFDGKDMLSNVADVSGQGNHGALSGQTSTTTVRGVMGQALEFDGGNDYVNMGNDLGITTYPFTMAGWGKATSTNAQMIAVLVRSNSTTVQYGFYTQTDTMCVFARNGTPQFQCGSTNIADDNWHHFVIVFNSDTDKKLYVDGVNEANLTTSVTLGAVNNFDIGRSGDGSPCCNWGGQIDDVRIYNRALSANEVSRLYDLGATTKVGVTLKTNPTLKDGLVGHWTFDGKDITDDQVLDRSGQGNHGGFYGGATTSAATRGKIGQALDFDGINDYVGINATPITGYPHTLCAWGKFVSGGTDRIDMVSVANSSSEDNRFSILIASDSFYYVFRDSGAQWLNAGSPLPDTWYHVCGVSTASNSHRLYVDGAEIGFSSTNVTPDGLDWTSIGQSGDSTPGWGTGAVDDARIYNRALSANEVSRLYDLGATTKVGVTLKTNPTLKDGLVGHWTFDGKDMLSNVADVSGQGNHGALVGQTSTTTAIGKVGQALSFDGSNDYVVVSDGADFTFNDFSVSAWVYINAVNPSDQMEIVTKWDGDTPARHFLLGVNTNGNHYTAWTTSECGASGIYTPNVAPPVGEWVHIIWTFDYNDDYRRIYENGAEVDSFDGSTSRCTDSTADIAIGARGDDAENFDGLIDDVRIYNRLLSAEEISRLYEMTK